MKAYLPEAILLVLGLLVMGLLLYLGAVSGGWLPPLCYLCAAVVYFGWQQALLSFGWRLAGEDPDDFNFHFPG